MKIKISEFGSLLIGKDWEHLEAQFCPFRKDSSGIQLNCQSNCALFNVRDGWIEREELGGGEFIDIKHSPEIILCHNKYTINPSDLIIEERNYDS